MLMDSPPSKGASFEGLRALTNTFDETYNALKAFYLPVESLNYWLNFLVVSKVDKESQQLWKRETASEKRPTFSAVLKYLCFSFSFDMHFV